MTYPFHALLKNYFFKYTISPRPDGWGNRQCPQMKSGYILAICLYMLYHGLDLCVMEPGNSSVGYQNTVSKMFQCYDKEWMSLDYIHFEPWLISIF